MKAEYNIKAIPINADGNKTSWNYKARGIKVLFTLEHENGKQRVFEGILKEV